MFSNEDEVITFLMRCKANQFNVVRFEIKCGEITEITLSD